MRKPIFPFLLLILLAQLLFSCSAEKPKSPEMTTASETSEEVEATPAASREAVFIYNDKKVGPSRLILKFTDEPVLLPSGYVRLVGVVSGGRPMACIEIGGRALVLGEGERLNDYRVIRIADGLAVLEK